MMGDITTEKHNEGLVKLLIELINKCDGETINYAVSQSVHSEYVFDSKLRCENILRNQVGRMEDVVDMYSRLQLVKEDIKGIESWASENCIDISSTFNHEYPLSRYLGNLSEISDMDNAIREWRAPYKVVGDENYYIRMKDVENARKEFVVQCDSITTDAFEVYSDAVEFMSGLHEDCYLFSRVWVKVKGIDEAFECNVLKMGTKTMIKLGYIK